MRPRLAEWTNRDDDGIDNNDIDDEDDDYDDGDGYDEHGIVLLIASVSASV